MFNRHNTDHDNVAPFSDETPNKLGLRYALALKGKLNREGHLSGGAYMVRRGLSRAEALKVASALAAPTWREVAPKGEGDGKAVNRDSGQRVYNVAVSADLTRGKVTYSVVARPNPWRADALFRY